MCSGARSSGAGAELACAEARAGGTAGEAEGQRRRARRHGWRQRSPAGAPPASPSSRHSQLGRTLWLGAPASSATCRQCTCCTPGWSRSSSPSGTASTCALGRQRRTAGRAQSLRTPSAAAAAQRRWALPRRRRRSRPATPCPKQAPTPGTHPQVPGIVSDGVHLRARVEDLGWAGGRGPAASGAVTALPASTRPSPACPTCPSALVRSSCCCCCFRGGRHRARAQPHEHTPQNSQWATSSRWAQRPAGSQEGAPRQLAAAPARSSTGRPPAGAAGGRRPRPPAAAAAAPPAGPRCGPGGSFNTEHREGLGIRVWQRPWQAGARRQAPGAPPHCTRHSAPRPTQSQPSPAQPSAARHSASWPPAHLLLDAHRVLRHLLQLGVVVGHLAGARSSIKRHLVGGRGGCSGGMACRNAWGPRLPPPPP